MIPMGSISMGKHTINKSCNEHNAKKYYLRLSNKSFLNVCRALVK